MLTARFCSVKVAFEKQKKATKNNKNASEI
jgi:hypothetical protein